VKRNGVIATIVRITRNAQTRCLGKMQSIIIRAGTALFSEH